MSSSAWGSFSPGIQTITNFLQKSTHQWLPENSQIVKTDSAVISHTHVLLYKMTSPTASCLSHSILYKRCTSECVCIIEYKPPEKPYKIRGRRLLWSVDAQGPSREPAMKDRNPSNNFHFINHKCAKSLSLLSHWAFLVSLSITDKYNLQGFYACKYSSSK